MDLLIHEQIYRTESLINKIKSTSITVCGCGALGSNLIDNITRQGFQKIMVIDKDRIEAHNRGTQIWDGRETGQFKTERMKQRVFSSTGTSIISVPKELTEETIDKYAALMKNSIVIDTFDNSQSRKLVFDYCSTNNIACLHIGLHQDYAEIIWNNFYTIPKGNPGLDVCEYPLARNIILLAVAAGSETLIKYIKDNIQENYAITLQDLKITKFDFD